MTGLVMKRITLKTGETLIIRRPEVQDAENMIKYLNKVGGESDNLLFGEGEFRLTVEQEEKYIEKMKQEKTSIMVIGTVQDEIVSIAQISCMGRKRVSHNGEIAISVIKKSWGKGIGSEMMRFLIEHARETGRIKNITLGVRSDNSRAIGLYKSLGFHKTGMVEDYFNINEEFFNKDIMQLKI